MTPEQEFNLGFNLMFVSIIIILANAVLSYISKYFDSQFFVYGLTGGLIIFGIGAYFSLKTKEGNIIK